MNTDLINALEYKYSQNIKITKQDEKFVNLTVLESFNEHNLLLSLENFLKNLEKDRVYELNSSYVFDEANSSIIGPKDKKVLTSREVIFLKMLLLTKSIVTYTQMISILWKDQSDVSSNAIRLFVKNIKKKLPCNTLKNFQDIGYKLVV